MVVWNEEKRQAWAFIKETSTGGGLSTVDVVFPGAPFHLALAPERLRLMLLPYLSWVNNDTWSKVANPWSPQYLGLWPVADQRVSERGGQPIEETANQLLMLAAIAQRQQGNVTYLTPYRPILRTWAEYLNVSLPDPANQLCTDDFEGPEPHNANLAVKGIIGLTAYAVLLRFFGQDAEAARWDSQAAVYGREWMDLALDPVTADTGEGSLPHYKQRYDLNATWSSKYNLLWQYLLDTTAFPDSVRRTENAFYQTQANAYGIPLDNRNLFAKTDWLSWIAALAFDNATQQERIIDFIYQFAATSPDRQPFSDLYDTTTNRYNGVFIARFVMGALWALPLTTIHQQREQLPADVQRWAVED